MWRAFLGQLDARGRDPVGARVRRWLIRLGEKGGSDVGKTKRGKGSKWMAVVDGQGIPLGIHVTSATPAEVNLVEATLQHDSRRLRVGRQGGLANSRRRRLTLCVDLR